MRKKPLQLGGLEWGGLAFHCWKHRLGVRLVWASQDQELGDQLPTVLGGLTVGSIGQTSRLLLFHT